MTLELVGFAGVLLAPLLVALWIDAQDLLR